MAVFLNTNRAQALLDDFKAKIRAGHIVTWACDADGDFTHSVDQWKNRAWLRPVVTPTYLRLHILKPQGRTIDAGLYGVYHGRFIESMVAHCSSLFDTGAATAKPVSGVDQT